jgi:iron(III) transport system permease protein
MGKISTNLEYAAYNMGASRWHVFKDVFWPLCRPGVAGGVLMAAINVLTDFGNPIMIGGDLALLPTEAYMQIVGWYDMKTAAILASALMIPSFVIFILNRFWVGRRSYVTVTGKEISLEPFKPNPAVKWGLFTFCILISFFVLLVYGSLFVGAFTKAWGYDWSFTWDNMGYVWEKFREVWNSIKYSALSSIFASILAMILAYIVQKKFVGVNKLLDFFAVLPSAVPGMFLGLGFVIAFNTPPVKLTGTGLIMVLALLFWNLPTCYSACAAGIQQIGESVEDAALNLGADSFRSFKDIIVPLLRVPFLSGFVLSFLRSVTCLSVIIFIYSPRTTVGTASILGLVSNGMWGAAAAFTMVLIAIAFSVLIIANRFLKKQGGSLNL